MEQKNTSLGHAKNVIEGVARNEAEKIKATLEEVGAPVEIKCP
jgi:ribosomal protein L7/L12